MGALGTTAAIAAALAALWIVIAAALSIVAARRLRDATNVISGARSLQNLLQLSPGRPLVVLPDGSIQVDERLLREIGFERAPKRLSGLAGKDRGLVADDLTELEKQVRDAAISGGKVECQVRVAVSGRVLDVRGAPAPAPEPAGTLVLWMFDTSAAESERSKLSQRLSQTEAALDALTRLIEAAPFPMWYRGPDLNLGLVNSAFVEAVEGRNAADVIARSAELVGDTDQAKATALAAIENGKPTARKQAAIVRGERRMLEIVNVPLPTGAVAGFALDVQQLEDARAELARQVQSQRDLVDRMTAGAAQFDSDRALSFFNRPFAAMAHVDPDWLSEKPEFDRVLERMREQNRVPETRDFPTWKSERRDWFTSPEEVIEEDWMLAAGPLAGGCSTFA